MIEIRGVRLLMAKCVRSNSMSCSLDIKGRLGEPVPNKDGSFSCAALPLRSWSISCSINPLRELPENSIEKQYQ